MYIIHTQKIKNMSFQYGNKYGSKGKRGKGKVDADLKEDLKKITKEILASINVEDLTRTQKIQFLKTGLTYLLPREVITDTYIQEDQPLFIDDKPVVIAFNNAEERKEYDLASTERKLEMEKELRVDVWGNSANA